MAYGQKFYLFKHKNDISENSNFVHFWSNNYRGTIVDFYDFKNQVSKDPKKWWKEQVITEFNTFDELLSFYHPDYEWVELTDEEQIRFEKRNYETFSVDFSASDVLSKDTIFVKLIDTEAPNFPFYYYAEDITESSNQSSPICKYRVILRLDERATYDFNFHKWLDEYNKTFPFLEKTHDRFKYEDTIGYYLDYNTDTYLNIFKNNWNGTELLKSPNDEILSYEKLLYINSDYSLPYNDWINNVYNNWTKTPFAAFFSAGELPQGSENQLIQSDLSDINWSNKYISLLDNMNDDNYNSNGVYRWIITKTGDNVHSSTSGEKKGSIFTNKRFNVSKKFSQDIEDVLSIDENELFVDADKVIQGFHNGESWEINITKSFTLKNQLTVEDLANGIIIHTNNRIFKENIANFNIYSKHGEETHTIKVADNILNQFMKFNMINIFSYLASIKLFGVDPYMILDHNGNDYSNWAATFEWRDFVPYIFTVNIFSIISSLINNLAGTSSNFVTPSTKFEKIEENKEYILNGKGLNYQWDDNILPDVGRWVNNPGLKQILYVKFDGDQCIFGIKITGAKMSHRNPEDEIFLKNLVKLTFDNIKITLNNPIDTKNKNLELTGEELCLIPVLKEDQLGINSYGLTDTSLSKTIFFLNNADSITFSDNNIIGSLINDIPPLLLSIASKKNKNYHPYALSFTNIISNDSYTNDGNTTKSPFDLHAISVGRKDVSTTSPYREYNMPVIFTDTSYIPITIARSPIINDPNFDDTKCIGGNYFFKKFFDLMTNEELTRENTMEAEPALYNPNIFKWIYLTDGSHNLTLTADMVNLNQLYNGWEVNLNCALSNHTYFKLDLGNLKNQNFKFTKTFCELSSVDTRSFPYSTSAYNQWLSQNQVSYASAKALLDNSLRYNLLAGGLNMITAPIDMAGQGAIELGPIGAVAGAVAGVGAGLGGMVSRLIQNTKAIQNFNTEWQGRFINMKRSPAIWDGNGFSDGSINYAIWSAADNSEYNLGRTYSLPQILLEQGWYDVKFRGYPVNKPLPYGEYDNRRVFNFFSINTDVNRVELVNYLREKMSEVMPLFNLETHINNFLDSLKNGVRLWKRKYDKDKIDQYVKENIENDWVPPFNIIKGDEVATIDYSDTRDMNYNLVPENLTKDDYPISFIAPNDVGHLIGLGLWLAPIEVVDEYTIKQTYTSTSQLIATITYEDLRVANKEEFFERFGVINFNLFGTTMSIDAEQHSIMNNTSKAQINLSQIDPSVDELSVDINILDYNKDIDSELNVDSTKKLTGWLYNPV